MVELVSKEHQQLASRLRDILSVYARNADLVNIGAYKHGSNPRLDYALQRIDDINDFLKQDIHAAFTYDQTIAAMKKILQ